MDEAFLCVGPKGDTLHAAAPLHKVVQKHCCLGAATAEQIFKSEYG